MEKYDGNWQQKAACATEGDPDLFMDQKAQSIMLAKQICQKCVVRVYCLDEALKNNLSGTWGGTSDKERLRMRRSSRR